MLLSVEYKLVEKLTASVVSGI